MSLFRKFFTGHAIDNKSSSFVKTLCVFASLANNSPKDAHAMIARILTESGISTEGISEDIVKKYMVESKKVAAELESEYHNYLDIQEYFAKISKYIDTSSSVQLLKCCIKYVNICKNIKYSLYDSLSTVGVAIGIRNADTLTEYINICLNADLAEVYNKMTIDRMKNQFK